MKTTITLNDETKKQAQIKALQEGKTLSDVINNLLKIYVNGSQYDTTPVKSGKLSEQFHTADYHFEEPITSDYIYDKLK